MVVWGGYDGFTNLTTGGRYDPSNGVQRCENLRNSLVLNYDSPALTAERQARIYFKTNHANGSQPRPKRFRLF